MRARVVFACGVVAVVALVGTGPAAFAQSETTTTVKKLTHANQECIDKLEKGQDVDQCQQSPNPILPATNEIIWGSLSFVVLFFLLSRFAFPAIRKSMDARAERIRSNLDEAEQTKTEAQSILSEYQAKLADAKNESARIIEEARQAADNLRRDLQQRAEAEVNELKQRAQEDIKAQADRAMADLQRRVAELSIDLAERVVEHNLDRDTNMALIESYINQVGAPG